MTAHQVFKPKVIALESALERLVVDSSLHARFLNTLSRLEFLEAQRGIASVDLHVFRKETLQFHVEGTRHAWMFKKLACRLDGTVADSFGHQATFAGDAWDEYQAALESAVNTTLQEASATLATVESGARTCASWLAAHRLTELYSVYEPMLAASGIPNVVAVIIEDKLVHIESLGDQLAALDDGLSSNLEVLSDVESNCFRRFWGHIEACVEVAAA